MWGLNTMLQINSTSGAKMQLTLKWTGGFRNRDLG